MSAVVDGELRIEIERRGSAVVLRVTGELDMASAPHLTAALRSLEQPFDTVILDLSELTFMDSSGINLAIAEHRRAETNGLEFVLAGAGGEVLRVLALTGVDGALPMVPDVEAALSPEEHIKMS